MAEGTVPLAGLVLRSSVSFLKGIPQYHAAVAFERPLKIFDGPPWAIAGASQAPVLKSSPPGLFPSDRQDASHALIEDGDSAMIAAFFSIGFYINPDAALDEMSRLNDW
jgi:hypothetical protein